MLSCCAALCCVCPFWVLGLGPLSLCATYHTILCVVAVQNGVVSGFVNVTLLAFYIAFISGMGV